jgi:hypothetical protein
MKLHEDYGVNPTIRTCFFCGENTNEVVLLGDTVKGEAPRFAVVGYEPCEKCQETFKQGILIIEAEKQPVSPNQPDLCGGYPTGSHWVVTEDAIQRMLEPSMAQDILKARMAMISRKTAQALGLYQPQELEN